MPYSFLSAAFMAFALGASLFKPPLSSSNGNFSSIKGISAVPLHFLCPEIKGFSVQSFKIQRTFLSTTNGDVYNTPDIQGSLADHDGLKGQSESQQPKIFTANELMKRLKRYGVSGILSYGLLNTVYYLSIFLVVWFYVAPVPGRMGYAAAVKRFLKVMAMVWAGSQVTKLARIGGALALSPFVDRGLTWVTIKFKFESQGRAFTTIMGICFGLALVLFFAVTLLWA